MLWGCGSTPSSSPRLTTNIVTVGQASQSYETYLKLAQQSAGTVRQAYQLLAVRAALNNGQTELADAMLGQLPSSAMLSDDHRLELQLLQSLRFAYADDFPLAIASLTPNSNWQVSPHRLLTLYRQQANFFAQNNQPSQAAKALINALAQSSDLLTQTELRKAIWQEYQRIDIEQLNELATTASNDTERGWLTLASIDKNAMYSPELLQQQLMQWSADYPNHEMSNHLPQRLVDAANVKPYKPQKISIILPLSGRYTRLGQAVQNGFLSHLMTRNSNQEINIIDSNASDGASAYQQAIDEQSDFIIGPLLKNNVEQANKIVSAIPTLFLNTPQDVVPLPNQFYFSMDRESETVQGAHHIYQLGKEHPVIVAPDNARGHQLVKLFTQQWQELQQDPQSTSEVESIYFSKDSELKATIERLFETDKSQKRINQIRYLVGTKMKAETHSRRDIDAIYLIANPKQTSMLMPSVEVTVSAFANQVPVFVGSSGNAYQITDTGLTHLNQLTVSEIPWLLSSSQELTPSYVQSLWPKMKQSQLRLFAMGHDAYGLIERLAQMRLFPEYRLNGLSGTLNLDENGKIYREMSWAQFQRGRLKTIQ